MEKLKFAFDWLRGVGRNAVSAFPEVALWLVLSLAILAFLFLVF